MAPAREHVVSQADTQPALCKRNLVEHHLSAMLVAVMMSRKGIKTFFPVRVLTETFGLRINVTVFILFN
jgi:hypothetical protein